MRRRPPKGLIHAGSDTVADGNADRRQRRRLPHPRRLLRFVLGIGVIARRSISDSLDFFLSGRSLPAWVTGLAFISANLGAVEIMGMSANGAEIGIATVHYFWIGAIPAMLFLGVVMMPFYYGSKVRSVPEFMFRRFGTKAHLVNAISLRGRPAAHRRRQPLPARLDRARAARLAAVGGAHRRRHHRALLHHPRWPVGGDLQRGAAVLRHRRLAAAARHHRPEPGRRLGRPRGEDHRVAANAAPPEAEVPSAGGPAELLARPGPHRASSRRPGRSSASSSASASCCPSATGRRTSSRCSARWPPTRSPRPRKTPIIGSFPKMFVPFLTIIPGMIAAVLVPEIMKLKNGEAVPGRRLGRGRRLQRLAAAT